MPRLIAPVFAVAALALISAGPVAAQFGGLFGGGSGGPPRPPGDVPGRGSPSPGQDDVRELPGSMRQQRGTSEQPSGGFGSGLFQRGGPGGGSQQGGPGEIQQGGVGGGFQQQGRPGEIQQGGPGGGGFQQGRPGEIQQGGPGGGGFQQGRPGDIQQGGLGAPPRGGQPGGGFQGGGGQQQGVIQSAPLPPGGGQGGANLANPGGGGSLDPNDPNRARNNANLPQRQRGTPLPANTNPLPGDEVVIQQPTQKVVNAAAVFSGLDKITGRIIAFDVNVNETVQFGALQVTPRACYTRPPTETANTDAFLEVNEVTLQGEVKRVFTGWMYAASPGLHGVEHPIYDVWLVDCRKEAANVASAQNSNPPGGDAPKR